MIESFMCHFVMSDTIIIKKFYSMYKYALFQIFLHVFSHEINSRFHEKNWFLETINLNDYKEIL